MTFSKQRITNTPNLQIRTIQTEDTNTLQQILRLTLDIKLT